MQINITITSQLIGNLFRTRGVSAEAMETITKLRVRKKMLVIPIRLCLKLGANTKGEGCKGETYRYSQGRSKSIKKKNPEQ